MEAGTRPLPRLPRPVAAAGLGAVLLGVPLVVTFGPHIGSGPAGHVALAANEGQRNAAAALKTAAAFRAEERTSRDRTVPSAPVIPVVETPAKGLKPVPHVTSTHPSAPTPTPKPTTRPTTRPQPKPTPKPRPKPQPKRVAPGVSTASCPISPSIESHLTSNARAVYRAVCAAFGHTVSAFGGYRAGSPGDHGSGRAVDIMVSGDPGWAIARYVQAHSRELHVTYVIYQQHIWLAGTPTSHWRAMEDRGSRTANHYDHVHVSVS